MKKFFVIFVIAILAMADLSLCNFALADVDAASESASSSSVSFAADVSAYADAYQSQEQKQKQSALANNSFNYSATDSRNHITAPLLGAFVGAGANMSSEGWIPFVCQRLFKSFDSKRLDVMSSSSGSGAFSDRKGGFFKRLFGSQIKKTLHFSGESDSKENTLITLIDWDPTSGGYANDKILGEFSCEGDYGWPKGASLGKCLKAAKDETGANRVFASYRVRRDPKNSGVSFGSGAAGAKMLGGTGEVDRVAGAMSLGGLIGTTTAYVDEAYDWYVIALNSGPVDPPIGFNACGQPQVIEPTIATAPKAAPAETLKKCDPDEVLGRIEQLIETTECCLKDCFNNMLLWKQIGDNYTMLYECTAKAEYLREAKNAYERSLQNFSQGVEPSGKRTKALKGAQKLKEGVLYNLSWVLLKTEGQTKAIKFAQKNRMVKIPEVYGELKILK